MALRKVSKGKDLLDHESLDFILILEGCKAFGEELGLNNCHCNN